jgi:hypothetical protein
MVVVTAENSVHQRWCRYEGNVRGARKGDEEKFG